MKLAGVLLVVGFALVLAAIFFFVQRGQLASELSALEAEHYTAENEMNREIEQAGQASEDTRWRWLELGNDKAVVEFSMTKSGIASLVCLVIGIAAGSFGFYRLRRQPKPS